LYVLERVALGRAARVDAESESQAGLARGQLRDSGYSTAEVRACAFRSIGQVASAEALEFLTNLQHADIGRDDSQEVWSASRVALYDARLRQIHNPQFQVDFLESTLKQPDMGRGPVGSWVVNELCDRGSQSFLPVIENAIRARKNGQRDEDEIAFCVARMTLVASNPDRVTALASILNLEQGSLNQRLTIWAIGQLFSMNSRAADAELARFWHQIDDRFHGAADPQGFWIFRQEVKNTLVYLTR
jgi:hypothetical protein